MVCVVLAGAAAEAGEVAGGEVAAHRVLVFAQLKSLLDLVETEVGVLAPWDTGLLQCSFQQQSVVSKL